MQTADGTTACCCCCCWPAGKLQRKFLLLAPPGGDVACALVEASKYTYLYRATTERQEYGEHQVRRGGGGLGADLGEGVGDAVSFRNVSKC